MKNLLVLATHFIDENVISEFRKMQNTPNVDAVLIINNTEYKFNFQNRIEEKIFFDTTCKCFFFDLSLSNEMQLPHFIESGEQKFGNTVWHSADFKFYYIRKFFPDYDYYWMFDYDVFCNAETYAGFLEKFTDTTADLLIQTLSKGSEIKNDFIEGIDWIYNDLEKVYVGLFAVVRLSARAIDFLYKKRLEQGNFFRNSDAQNKQWIFCEVFVPTELINRGFSCENLNEKRVRFLPHIYLNDERIFLKPDNHLYHPVKSVKAEISKLENQYADLFLSFKKIFFTQLLENLNSISTANIKNFPIQFDENFDSMVIDLGGLRCEVWFLKDILHKATFKLCSAIVFEGEYLKYFKIIEQYVDLKQIPAIQIMQSSTSRMLTYSTETFDNVSQIANVTNILIEMALTVLQEKNL